MADYQSNKNQKKFDTLQIIEEIIKYSGLKPAQFLKKIGVNQTLVQDIKNGKTNNITKKTASKIIEHYPDISESFLLTGIPPMLLTEYSGNIHHNQAGGDIIGNGSVKSTETAELDKLISAVATLTETNKQQTEQIGELIKFITSKQ